MGSDNGQQSGDGTGWDRPVVRAMPRRLAIGVAVIAVIGGLALWGRGGVPPSPEPAIPVEQDTGDAEPTPRQDDAPASQAEAEPAGGEWVALGQAPVSAPSQHEAVWTGAELVVWGGGGDQLAAFDPESETWRGLSRSPVIRNEALPPVWTGEALLVWGSMRPEGGRLVGAEYDPEHDSWGTLPSSPLPALATGVVVWTGRQALIWGAPESGRTVAASYDPTAGRWELLPTGPMSAVETTAGRWTDRELVVWGTTGSPTWAPPARSYAAVFDPVGRRWRALPEPPLEAPAEAVAAWTGQEVLLWGRPEADSEDWWPPIGAAIDPDARPAEWRRLAERPEYAPHPPSMQVTELSGAWADDRLFAVGGVGQISGWVYHPDLDRWTVLPEGGGARLRPAVAWTGDQLLVWGGLPPTASGIDLMAWRPDDVAEPVTCNPQRVSDAAPATPPPGWARSSPHPFEVPLAQSSAVAAGSQLFVLPDVSHLGGIRARIVGASYDRETDRWSCLPPGPVEARSHAGMVWTGEELLIWGGQGGTGAWADGAAYHPATRSWRRLPPGPLSPRRPLAAVWTGEELLLWGNLERRRPAADGAAYDPAANRWRQIADAPFPLNQGQGVWTGSEMVVFGSNLDSRNVADHEHARGAAYDPATDTWWILPDWPLSPQASSIAMAGDALLAWDYGLNAASYDPPADVWTPLASPPMTPMECYPESTTVSRQAVLAFFCDQAALLDVPARTWSGVELPQGSLWSVQAREAWSLESADGVVFLLDQDGAVLTYDPTAALSPGTVRGKPP